MGGARRTHAEFAERHELAGRTFEPAVAGAPAHGIRGCSTAAVAAVGEADATLATLQDSMLPGRGGRRASCAPASSRCARLARRGVRAARTQLVRTLGR